MPIACSTIELFIQLVKSDERSKAEIINDTKDDKKDKTDILTQDNGRCEEIINRNNSSLYSSQIIPTHFIELWSESLLSAVGSLLKELELHSVSNLNHPNAKAAIQSIELILESQDQVLLRPS